MSPMVGGGGQNPPSSNGNSSLVGLLHSNNQNQSTADQAQPSPYQAPAKSPAGSQLNGNIMSPTPSQVIFAPPSEMTEEEYRNGP